MKKSIILVLLLVFGFGPALADIGSLSHLFLLGKGVKDTDWPTKSP